MKRLLILFVSVLASCCISFATAVTKNVELCYRQSEFSFQNGESYEYKPLLTEGKMWKVLVKKDLYPDSYVTYKVSGDTLVGNRTCKRIVVEDGTQTVTLAAYEEDKKFYCYFNDDEAANLMLDFGLEKGDLAYDFGWSDVEDADEYNQYVSDVDYIEVNGILRKRIKIDYFRSVPVYWVEGIGINMDYWEDTTIGYITGRRAYLLECYDNGQLIFSQSDFETANSIRDVSKDDERNESKYSLGGIRLDDNSKCRIYIKGGKKYLEK